jgi:hypothetical protein
VSIKTTKEYTCDICSGRSGEVESLPKKWAKVVVENKYVDRDFTDKHVCDECCKEIVRQVAA